MYGRHIPVLESESVPMSRTKLCLAIAILFTSISTVGIAKEPPTKRPPRTVNETTFVKQLLPTLYVAHNKRVDEVNQHFAELLKNIRACKNQHGLSAFVEEATSLQTKALMATDKAAHRRKIRQLFLDEVLRIDQIREVIRVQSKSLETALNHIDQNLLIDLGEGDTEIKPVKSQVASLKLDPILHQVDLIVDQVYSSVYDELGKSLVSVGAGVAGGLAVDGMAREQFSADGELTFLDSIFAAAIGLAADVVITEFADEVMETDATLRKSVDELADQVIRNCTVKGGAANTALQSAFVGLFHDHNRRMLYTVTDALRIDRKWALSVY